MYVSTAAGADSAARRVIVSTAVSTPQALRKRGFFADAAARLVQVSTAAGAVTAVRRVQVSTPAGNAID